MHGITIQTKSFRWRLMGATWGTYGRRRPDKLIFPSVSLVGGRTYVVSISLGEVFYFDISGKKWTQLNVPAQQTNKNNSVLVDDKLMICTSIGGPDRVLSFDLQLEEWTAHTIPPLPTPIPSDGCSEFVTSARVIVLFGGFVQNSVSNMLLQVDVDTREAIVPTVSGSPSPARNGHASCIMENGQDATMFIYGGHTYDTWRNDMHLLHIRNKRYRWSEGAVNTAGKPVCSSSLCYVAGKVILYGGFDVNYDDIDQLFVYDVHAKEWCRVRRKLEGGEYSVDGRPEKRSGHRAVICSNGMLVLGGFGVSVPWVSIMDGVD